MKIGLFTILPGAGQDPVIDYGSKVFLDNIQNRLHYEMEICEGDFSRYGSFILNLIFIQAGGIEPKFLEMYETLSGPIYLLPSGKNSSLAASMEITAFLQSKGRQAEIVHGNVAEIAERLSTLIRVEYALRALKGRNYGIIGDTSKRLIGCVTDRKSIHNKLGINIVNIELSEFTKEFEKNEFPEEVPKEMELKYGKDVIPQVAFPIYGGLLRICEKYSLAGLTIDHFNLPDTVRNASCLPLMILNRDGIITSCGSDMPGLISMAILNALTGLPVFQAEPIWVHITDSEVVFQHCTIPLQMVKDYNYEPDFNLGPEISARGMVESGCATIFKASGDIGKYFVSEAHIDSNYNISQLCLNQITLIVEKDVRHFIKEPLAGHYILVTGRQQRLVDNFFARIRQ